jgi:hypothetical protein
MYLTHSIIDGLKILGFDKETIKTVSREKSLEEIFLSTLFLNYIIVLIVFIIGTSMGSIQIAGKSLNLSVFFGLLMTYPFVFNVIIYFIYSIFGLTAELLNTSKKLRPLLSVGFHTGIVYTIIFYIIALLSVYSLELGLFILLLFVLYFLLTMFLSIKIIHNFSNIQTLITLFIPILVFFSLLLIVLQFIDVRSILSLFLI